MNILPQSKKDEIEAGYKRRVFVTLFWAGFFTLIICSVLMFPAYIIARSKLGEMSERKELNSEVVKEQTAIVNAPELINQKVALAIQNIKSVSKAARIAVISTTSKAGIITKKISYEKQKIIISGSAINRDSLILFKHEIDKIDFVKESSVPVGDFAKDKDLVFTMTINLKEDTKNE